MIAGYALHELLPQDHRRALYAAAEIVTDETLDDIQHLYDDGPYSETHLADRLPRKYLSRYDEVAARAARYGADPGRLAEAVT